MTPPTYDEATKNSAGTIINSFVVTTTIPDVMALELTIFSVEYSKSVQIRPCMSKSEEIQTEALSPKVLPVFENG